jgi:hypothetical protein
MPLDERVYKAQFCLSFIGSNAEALVPELVTVTGSQDPWSRLEAADILGKILSRPEISVPALENVLRQCGSGSGNCALVASVLGDFGTAAKSALPTLILMWRSSTNSQSDRDFLAAAIMKIDPVAAAREGIQ